MTQTTMEAEIYIETIKDSTWEQIHVYFEQNEHVSPCYLFTRKSNPIQMIQVVPQNSFWSIYIR